MTEPLDIRARMDTLTLACCAESSYLCHAQVKRQQCSRHPEENSTDPRVEGDPHHHGRHRDTDRIWACALTRYAEATARTPSTGPHSPPATAAPVPTQGSGRSHASHVECRRSDSSLSMPIMTRSWCADRRRARVIAQAHLLDAAESVGIEAPTMFRSPTVCCLAPHGCGSSLRPSSTARSARPASMSRTCRTPPSPGCGSTVTRPSVSRERSSRPRYPESSPRRSRSRHTS